jgi:hypothetical protein
LALKKSCITGELTCNKDKEHENYIKDNIMNTKCNYFKIQWTPKILITPTIDTKYFIFYN